MRKKDRNICWFALTAFVAAGVTLVGCGKESAEVAVEPPPDEAASTTPAPQPPPPPPPAPAPTPEPEQETAKASYFEDTHWVEGSEGNLIQGLNGGEYPPYLASFVKEVQRFLFDEGLYEGPVTGVLDEATMEAVAAFQQEHDIVQSGVPSPETRDAMQAETEPAESS